MNYIASITSQGQLTIPKSLREKYQIKKQAKAIIQDTGSGMLVKTFTDRDFWSLKGILKNNPQVRKNRDKNLQQIIKEENSGFEKALADSAAKEMGFPINHK